MSHLWAPGRRVFLQTAVTGMAGLLQSGWAKAADVAAPATINIVNSAGNLNLSFQQVLRDEKFFESVGLKATTINVSDGSKLIGSLLNGDQDVCMFAGFNQVFPAIAKGAKLKVLAASTILGQQAVFTARPEIQTLKDLEGKTVGVGSVGALLHEIMVALLRKNNVDISTIKFVNVGSTADVFRAVVAKTVDAGPSTSDVLDEIDKFGVHVVKGGEFWNALPEFTFQGAFTSDRAIAEKRDALVRALAAYAKLYRFISGPDSLPAFEKARNTVLGAKTLGSAESEWKFIQEHQTLAVNLAVDEQRIQYIQDLNVSLGVQDRIMPYEQVADMSLARDALKMLG